MTDIDYMIEHVAADLIVLLIEKRGLTFTEAVDTLYTSDTYAKLCNKDTGLYFQSSKYVYTFLEHELKTGVMG
ncbi:MAG: hypothetical protein Q4D56_13575 [Bacteroides sp.]|nr:hypothetical protein [Bacteroides sp.]